MSRAASSTHGGNAATGGCRRDFLAQAGLLAAGFLAGPSLARLSAAAPPALTAAAGPLQLMGVVSAGWVKGITLDPLADRVYAPQTDSILAVDGGTLVTTTLAAGAVPPAYGIACDPFRRRVLLASEQWPPELISFSLQTGAINRRALPGIAPMFGSIALSPLLRRLYVWLHDVPTRAGPRTGIAAVDYVSGRFAGFVPIDAVGFSMRLTLNPTTKEIYGWAEGEQVLHVVDGASNLLSGSIDIPFAIQSVAVDRATGRAFVCGPSQLLVLDGGSHEPIAEVPIALGLGVAAAVDSRRNYVYVAGGSPLQLVRVDGAVYSVLDSLELGSDHVPFALAVSEAASRIYIGDADLFASPWEPFAGRITAVQA